MAPVAASGCAAKTEGHYRQALYEQEGLEEGGHKGTGTDRKDSKSFTCEQWGLSKPISNEYYQSGIIVKNWNSERRRDVGTCRRFRGESIYLDSGPLASYPVVCLRIWD
jgi:hypothetical protein